MRQLLRQRKLMIPLLVCSASIGAAPTETEKLPAPAANNKAEEVRAAAQFLALFHNELDCEKVGYLQTGEADEHFAPIFLSIDADTSRSLTKSELLNNLPARSRSLLGVTFAAMDLDANGLTTPDELRKYLNSAITLVDSDADGDVHPAELEHAMKTGTRLKATRPTVSAKAAQAPKPAPPPWVRHAKAMAEEETKKQITESGKDVANPAQ